MLVPPKQYLPRSQYVASGCTYIVHAGCIEQPLHKTGPTAVDQEVVLEVSLSSLDWQQLHADSSRDAPSWTLEQRCFTWACCAPHVVTRERVRTQTPLLSIKSALHITARPKCKNP